MLTVENLTTRYGISDRALRRRLDALQPVLGGYIQRGQNNALLFQDGALAILDRLSQLQRDAGLGLTDAASKVRNELLNGNAAPAEERPKSAEPSAEVHKLIQSYEDRIREQADMIQFLQEQVGKRDEQILALMPGKGEAKPGPQERTNGEPSKTRRVQDGRKLSRWQALRFVLLGR